MRGVVRAEAPDGVDRHQRAAPDGAFTDVRTAVVHEDHSAGAEGRAHRLAHREHTGGAHRLCDGGDVESAAAARREDLVRGERAVDREQSIAGVEAEQHLVGHGADESRGVAALDREANNARRAGVAQGGDRIDRSASAAQRRQHLERAVHEGREIRHRTPRRERAARRAVGEHDLAHDRVGTECEARLGGGVGEWRAVGLHAREARGGDATVTSERETIPRARHHGAVALHHLPVERGRGACPLFDRDGVLSQRVDERRGLRGERRREGSGERYGERCANGGDGEA